MICPVCEHQQEAGFECEVCGRPLGGLDTLGPPPVPTARMEGLESTGNADAGEVPVERMGDLEVGRHESAGPVAEAPPPDLEHNAMARVGAVAVEKLADLSEDRVADDGARTVLPAGPVTCRYCRNVQAAGSICERCGMRLPTVIVVPRAPAGTAIDRRGDTQRVRCRACGAPALPGQKCGDCGRDVPWPDGRS